MLASLKIWESTLLNDSNDEIRSLLKSVSERIDSENGSANYKAFHSLALLLAEKGYDRSESWQVEAIKVARQLWTDTFDESEWNNQIELVAKKLDKGDAPAARLVWCALNRNTGLDAYGGEFLALTAFSAGVAATDIELAFVASGLRRQSE